MKKLNIHIYIAFAIFACLFVVGSFFDYQVNDALFHPLDTFGLTVSVIGTVPGYGVMAFLGGGLLYLGLKRELPNLAVKIIVFVLAAASFALSVYFSGKEFFGENGFYWLGIKKFWGYFIAFPADVAIAFLGYKLTSKSEYGKLWVVYLIMLAAIGLTLLLGVTMLKGIFHRPRFRSLGIDGVQFHSWWDPCKEYKSYIEAGHLTKEEFKSFPSGHAGSASVFMMSTLFLPTLNPKYKKATIIAFYSGFAWLLLVAFARMYVGAHFLSDVSMGALLGIIFFFIAKTVVENVKFFGFNEQTEQA